MKQLKNYIWAGFVALLTACSGGGSDEPYVEPEPVVPPVLRLNTPNYMGGALVQQIRYMGAFDKVYR